MASDNAGSPVNDGVSATSITSKIRSQGRTSKLRIGIVFVLILAVNLISFWCIWGLRQLTRWRTHVAEVRLQYELVLSSLKDAEIGQRGFLLTDDQQYLEPYLNASNRIDNALIHLDELQRHWEHKIPTAEIRKLADAVLTELRETITLDRGGQKDQAIARVKLGNGKKIMDQLRNIFAQIDSAINTVLRDADRHVEGGAVFSLSFLGLGGTSSILLLFWAFRALEKEVALRARAEDALQAANADLHLQNRELEAVNSELEAFSYSISHDLRAPLRHIDGFAHLLKTSLGENIPAEAARHLNIISQSTQRLGQLIDKLLAFSRVARVPMQQTQLNLASLVQEAKEEVETDNSGRAIHWKIGALPQVRGDAVLLRQVFVNLLSNAVKFTRDRNPAEIEIDTEGAGRFFVKDNGVGFDEAYKGKLFGVFQRLHSEKEFEGTGIGLANVKRIVQRHGGDIWAEASPGKGAVFHVSLPAN